MHFSSFFSLLLIIITIFSTSAAPHGSPKHAECARRVFRTLNTLCNHGGDLEFLKDQAYRCCKNNCELMEMMSFCVVGSSREERV